ncbi:hypothetical protein Nepgr_023788 [Nepenthes gracilis]|uniref:Uncharacterized protein n=1 Tax=Nepenthes gracilis TaxID=150966 RepID=A0AAD3XZF5_NEPGR|nr:hypothetical protein Nepgr_023788 [Nepenthes gracilis]
MKSSQCYPPVSLSAVELRCSSTAFPMKGTSLGMKFFSLIGVALERQMSQGTWRRVDSEAQLTGALYSGHYPRALENWASLQDNYAIVFFIVDFHAITLLDAVHEMSRATKDATANYLACGINPS